MFGMSTLVFASPGVDQFRVVSGGTSLPVRTESGTAISAPVGDSSRWLRGEESYEVSGVYDPSVASHSTFTKGTVARGPWLLDRARFHACPTFCALGA